MTKSFTKLVCKNNQPIFKKRYFVSSIRTQKLGKKLIILKKNGKDIIIAEKSAVFLR